MTLSSRVTHNAGLEKRATFTIFKRFGSHFSFSRDRTFSFASFTPVAVCRLLVCSESSSWNSNTVTDSRNLTERLWVEMEAPFDQYCLNIDLRYWAVSLLHGPWSETDRNIGGAVEAETRDGMNNAQMNITWSAMVDFKDEKLIIWNLHMTYSWNDSRLFQVVSAATQIFFQGLVYVDSWCEDTRHFFHLWKTEITLQFYGSYHYKRGKVADSTREGWGMSPQVISLLAGPYSLVENS